MRSLLPPREYVVLIERIEQLARELGHIEAELQELEQHAARLEALLERYASGTSAAPAAATRPAAIISSLRPIRVPPYGAVGTAVGSPAPVPQEPTPVTAGLPDADTRPAVIAVRQAGEAPPPPATAPPGSGRTRPAVAPATALERLWDRVTRRYRRAPWVAASIVGLIVISTLMSLASHIGPDPTEPEDRSSVDAPRPTDTMVAVASTMSAVARPATPTAMPSPTPRGAAFTPGQPASRPTNTALATIPTVTPAPVESPPAPATEATGTSPAATGTVSLVPTQPTVTATLPVTSTATAVMLTPGGVGSTEASVVDTYGPEEAQRDGRSVYADGSVLVTFAADNRAVWVTFIVNQGDLTLTYTEADDLAAYYRPGDAQLVLTTVERGVVRRVYSSAALAHRFGIDQVEGRRTDRYVEVIRFDPSSERANSIDMAIGEEP